MFLRIVPVENSLFWIINVDMNNMPCHNDDEVTLVKFWLLVGIGYFSFYGYHNISLCFLLCSTFCLSIQVPYPIGVTKVSRCDFIVYWVIKVCVIVINACVSERKIIFSHIINVNRIWIDINFLDKLKATIKLALPFR